MVMFRPKVERWRAIAQSERGNLPTDLVLAIIDNESRGKPGAIAGKRTKHPELLQRREGPSIVADRALGLMQVIPRNIANYARTVAPVTYDDMVGTTPADARIQIRLGVSVLRSAMASLHRRDPSIWPWPSGSLTDEQLWIGLAAYAIGSGNVGRKLDRLGQEGKPQTWASLVNRFPSWGQPHNNPIGYVRRIAGLLDAPFLPIKPETARNSALIAIALSLLAILALSQKRKTWLKRA